MHTVHHTDAFIVKKVPTREANINIWLFTREFGLIVAAVQGVRKQGAKLQMQLSEYALISADLVRGRDVWRLTSVREIENPFIAKDRSRLGRAYVRTLGAVERFCQGEEAHGALFEHLHDALMTSTRREFDPKAFDALSLWKVMALLGYIAPKGKDAVLFALPFEEAIHMVSEGDRARLVRETNNVIKETHL